MPGMLIGCQVQLIEKTQARYISTPLHWPHRNCTMAIFKERSSQWLDLSYDPDGDDNFQCYKTDDRIVMKNSGENQVKKFSGLIHVLGRDLDNMKTIDFRCILYTPDWSAEIPEIIVNSKHAVDVLVKAKNERNDLNCFAMLFVNCGQRSN